MDKQGLKDILKNLWVLEYSPLQKCFHIQDVREMLDYNRREFYIQEPGEPPGYFPIYFAATLEEIDNIAEQITSQLRTVMGDDIRKN